MNTRIMYMCLNYLFFLLAACAVYGDYQKRYIYKITPQGDLQIVVHFPDDWKGTDKRPAMVFFFGGGWNGGSLDQFEPQASYFASRGMITARADYRVKSRHNTHPEQAVEDGKSAVRWLRDNAATLGLDPQRIAASGGSAGGHVAACTFLTKGLENAVEDQSISSQPNALLLFNPVLNLMQFDLADRAESEESAEQISPLLQLEDILPPTMMFYGTNDKFFQQGQAFMRKAREQQITVDLFVAQNQPHGFFNTPPWLQKTILEADRFLHEIGFLSGEPTINLNPEPKPTPTPGLSSGSMDGEIPENGRLRLSFEEYNPLSKDRELSMRLGVRVGAGTHGSYFYNQEEENYEVYIPPNYNGRESYGLFVWISASPSGDIPDMYMPVMDKHKIIWIGANKSGNSKDVFKRRIPLALDAAFNMRKHYNIDQNRIYISGLSGGGRASSAVAMHYPDIFSGGLFIIGANYWQKKASRSKPGNYWPAGYPKPGSAYLQKAERNGRYVLLTGEHDFNREQMEIYFEEGYSRHLKSVLYIEVQGMGHTIPNAEWFETAIQYLDDPMPFRDLHNEAIKDGKNVR